MKLNKNGWSFLSFIIFLIIFVICLIMSAIGLRKFGLLDEDYHFVRFDQIEETRLRYEEEKAKKNSFDYTSLEETLVSASKKYVSEYYENNIGESTLIVKSSTLIDKSLMETLKDNKNKDCSGYVEVKDVDNSLEYKPFLKCKNYTTDGYESRKDK